MKFTRIKGDDRPHNVLRLPLLGKIRLGVKKVTPAGKEYPAETDYFVCPQEVQAKCGDQPRTLQVMLPVENEEMFFRQFYALYGSNQKVKCMGNGEMAERRSETNVADKIDVSCPHPENCDYAKKNGRNGKPGCSARTIIQVVLPAVNMGGVYQISTGSINSDIDIRSGIEMSRSLFGRISWVPMVLQREEKKIADPSTGKMQTHWPVKLFPIASVEQVNLIRSDNTRILSHQERFALPEPDFEGPQADTPIEHLDGELEEEPKNKYEDLRVRISLCAAMQCLTDRWAEATQAKKSGTISDDEYKELSKHKDLIKAKISEAEKQVA